MEQREFQPYWIMLMIYAGFGVLIMLPVITVFRDIVKRNKIDYDDEKETDGFTAEKGR